MDGWMDFTILHGFMDVDPLPALLTLLSSSPNRPSTLEMLQLYKLCISLGIDISPSTVDIKKTNKWLDLSCFRNKSPGGLPFEQVPTQLLRYFPCTLKCR